MTTYHSHSAHRLAGVLIAIAGAVAVITGCTPPAPSGPDPAGQIAADYFIARSAGDAETMCRLSEPPEAVAGCVETASDGTGLVDRVDVVAVYPWPQANGGPDGRAVVVQSVLKNGNIATPDVVGLLPGPGDPAWLVDRFDNYELDPRVEDQVIAAVNAA